MLEIKVDHIPFGDETKRETIGVLVLVNDGTGHADTGNYIASIKGGEYEEAQDFVVKSFPRRLGFWKLILRSLKEKIMM